MRTFIVEKDWITAAGLRAVVIKSRHRCGYVAVREDHPAFGKNYNEQLDCISQDAVDTAELGSKSPIIVLTAAVGSDRPHEKVRRSLDILIDVHGSLTYSSTSRADLYPVESEGNWWFGFDCAHYRDDESIGGQPLDYCVAECERMATQFAALATVPAIAINKE